MLDEIHSDLPKPPDDDNVYTLGVVNKHKVAIACLPKGTYGNNAAARVATAMVRTFPSIKFGLMVGIGGGNPVDDVRLGDVVVSTPTGEYPGVIQWDFGKVEEGGGFKRIGSLNNPPSALRTALGKLESFHEMYGTKIPEYLDHLAKRWPRLVSKYIKSDSHVDPLLLPLNDKKPESSDNSIWPVIFLLLHKAVVSLFYRLSGRGVVGAPEEGATAKGVHGDHSQLQVRDMRVHYGLIASGNSVIKSAEHRDMLNEQFGGKLLCVLEVDAMPTLRKIEHQLEEVSKCIKGLRSAQLCQEDQAILNWLTPNDYSLQQNDICRNKRAGTGKWLLNSSEYQYWLATEKQTLFCPGIPGAGKTALTSTIISDLYSRFREKSDNWGALPEVIKELRKTHEKERSEPCINLITTSRFIPDIVKKFEDFPSLEIRASNEDIENYLGGCFDGSQTELEFSSEILGNQNIREEIKRVITDFAGGIFLLAQLYVRTFEGKVTVKHVKIALKEIRERQQVSTEVGKLKLLEEAYDKTMERIEKKTEFSQVAKNALQWIVSKAVGSFGASARIGDRIDKERDIVRLVYYTPQECFKQSKGHGFPDAETYIAKACIGYLSYRSFESGWCQSSNEFRKRLDRNLLYDYTARNWGYHTQKSSGLDSRVIEFLEDGAKIQSSAQAMMSTDTGWTINLGYTAFYEPGESLTDLKGLYLAVFFGLENATSEMILRARNLNLTDGLRRTPLSWAAGNGRTAIGELLFKSGAEVDFSDIDGRTPLFWAAAGGHLSMIELLIRNGANVNATDIFGVTALHIAARRSYLRAISFLLDNGADGDMRDICGGTSLTWAISNENNAAARLLLETCTNLDCIIPFGPRRALTRLGEELPGYGVYRNLQPSRSGSIPKGFQVRVRSRAESFLDEFDFTTRRQKEFYYDMPCSGYDDSTPQDRGIFGKLDSDNTECLLRRAVVNGDETVVRILIVKGSRPDLEYQKGLTPLSEAVKRRNQSIFELLVAGFKGMWAKIDLKNKFGRSYLSMAAENGHEIIVELLLKMGSNVESKDETGLTPLCWAAKEGHGKISEEDDNRGRTPLSYAAEGGYADVVKLLLETGRVDPDPVRPRAGRTPLSYAAAGGHLAVVELLLGTGRVDPDSMYMASGASRIRTPLPYGSEYLYNPIPSITDRTPLSHAAEHGHVDVVELLLGREGVDPDSVALSTGQTPLSYAADNGHIGVVDLLLATGRVNPDSRATNFHFAGRTPLSFASEKGYEAIVQCLLSRNADPYSRSKPYINTYRYWDPELVNGGRIPISYATTPRNEIILKLLLEKAKAETSLEIDSGRGPSYSADGQKVTAVVIGPSRLAGGANKGKEFSDDERGSRTGDLWEGEVYFRVEQYVKLDSELRGFTRAYEGREMRQVLERLVDTDLGDGIKQTLLYCACRWGHEGIVEKLLDGGLGANFEIRLGRVESYKFTAGLFSDVEPSSWRGPPSYWRTPLLYAAEGGYEHIVGRLLKAGTEANLEDNDGLTPLSYAVKEGYEAVVRLLLDVHKSSGSLYDLKGKTPLTYAAKRGNVAIMKLLLEREFDPDSGDPEFDDKTPLASAVKNGHGEVVKLLLGDSRVNRNKVSGPEKRTPLSYAAEKGYTKTLEMLLDSDTIDPESRSKRRSALFWAVDNGHEKIVKALLASGADYSTTSTTDSLRILRGFDPNYASCGKTALASAASRFNGAEAVVKLLLDRGADPNSVSKDGRAALVSAVSTAYEAEPVIKLLLDRGADPNYVSEDGTTALELAVTTRAESVVKLLLDGGANPNSVSSDGITVLALAGSRGFDSIVGLLLYRNADPEAKSRDGSTALSRAIQFRHKSTANLL
ncbi:hypothetical protein TWF128_003836 [Orbilia oligospora]|nr:hypothetical protein TWF128_003836 [Orbilia oligospora]